MAASRIDHVVAESLYRDGVPLRAIAARFGVHPNAVLVVLHAHGIPSHRSLKVRKIPTEIDLAYIAGLFDGEGHIGIALGKRPRITPYQHLLAIGISNAHRGVLDFVGSSFGVGNINQMRKASEGLLAIFSIQMSCLDALHVLQLLQPYLRIKADVCALGIEFQNGITAGRDTEWREAMRVEIKRLNKLT